MCDQFIVVVFCWCFNYYWFIAHVSRPFSFAPSFFLWIEEIKFSTGNDGRPLHASDVTSLHEYRWIFWARTGARSHPRITHVRTCLYLKARHDLGFGILRLFIVDTRHMSRRVSYPLLCSSRHVLWCVKIEWRRERTWEIKREEAVGRVCDVCVFLRFEHL